MDYKTPSKGQQTMRSIANLFGRSPFAPLRHHMDTVAHSVHLLDDLFKALFAEAFPRVQEIATQIQGYEHDADLTKNDIRNHLPKSLFLPIDRSQLLEILTLQDRLADRAEDISVLATLCPLRLPSDLQSYFNSFLAKNLDTFKTLLQIITEMHELLETSFGGFEAERVSSMVDHVALSEHEVDILQRELLRAICHAETQFSLSSFYLWQKIIEALSDISNLSETLANRVRMTLELK